MTKQVQRSEIQGFSKGLITDLNPLNSQLDTTVSESNFELLKDGTRSRRLGLDAEAGYTLFDTGQNFTSLQLSAVGSFLWKGVGGEPSTEFFVSQLGNVLRFFEIESGVQGQTQLRGTLTLPVANNANLSFASIQGFLGIVTGTPNVLLVEFNPATQLFKLSSYRIRIRDFFGIEETLNTRFENDKLYKGPLNWQHYYNLYNQGWAIPRKPWWPVNGALTDSVYLGSNSNPAARSPSNSDKVWTGMTQKPISDTSRESYEAFDYRQFEAVTGADSYVSRGFFIIDAFNRGSSRYEQWVNHRNKYPQTGGIIGGMNPPNDTTTGGPTSIAAHSGRLFYSGCRGGVITGDKRSPNYSNYVFFTQLVRSQQDFEKCYQEGDPTSRESNDLVDTDGGFITISDAINIHTMYSIADKLFLIAENGVWTVSGGSGYGFSATNYLVERVSNYGGIPGKSFVESNGVGFFWGYDGIYTITKSQLGDWTVDNITKKGIDKFYKAIDARAMTTSQGFEDKARNQVRWVYTEGELFGDGQTKELILDLNFQAFVPFSISRHPTNAAYLVTGVQVGDMSIRYLQGEVYAAEDEVIVQNDEVDASEILSVSQDSNVKYLAVFNTGGSLKLAFTEYRNIEFEDWEFTGSPVDAPAHMETNAFTGGDFAIKKQVPYLTMAFAETEKTLLGDFLLQPSSCIGQFMWDFSHMARSNKWTREMQLYRKSKWYYGDTDVDNGFSLNIVKTKVRGIGKSFSLRVRTEPLNDCHIYGWNISLTSNGMT